jgi:hypothetical protein
MKHPNKLGARAKKRKRLSPKDKFDTVMAEFARGTLYSGSGEKVTDRNQALAIAFSESGLRRKKKKVEKSIRLVLRPKESIKNGTLIKVAGDWYFKGDGKARLGEDQPEEEMDSR